MGRPCQLACASRELVADGAGSAAAHALGAVTSTAASSDATASGPTMRRAHVRESIRRLLIARDSPRRAVEGPPAHDPGLLPRERYPGRSSRETKMSDRTGLVAPVSAVNPIASRVRMLRRSTAVTPPPLAVGDAAAAELAGVSAPTDASGVASAVAVWDWW